MALIGPWRRLAPAVCLLAVVLIACVGDQETAQTGNIQAVVVSSDLAVGQNRFVLGLLTQDNQVIT